MKGSRRDRNRIVAAEERRGLGIADRTLGWLDATRRGWPGPLLAALVVLASALPALFALPPLDRDEARFAQSTVQMLETGDFVNIRFQDQPRNKKPPGVNWLQALSVAVFSSVEQRAIWAYRLPSLVGAMAASAACAWGAAAFVGRRRGLLAGAVLGASFLLSSEAFIGKADAFLCAGVTLSMAALGRLYLAARRGEPAERGLVALLWIGQAAAILMKGPVGPAVMGLTLLALWVLDRDAHWMRRLGWGWGLLFLLAVVGPWAVAITVQTDGSFWSRAVGGDVLPKLAGGQEGHGAPPGYHLALSPLLIFPNSFLLPIALAHLWRARRTPLARFCAAWLVPSWLMLEAAPTKLPHYPLPLYGALAWLAAGALAEAVGPRIRWTGAILSVICGGVVGVVAILLAIRFGSDGALGWAAAGAALAGLAGLAGALSAATGALETGLLAAGVLGVAAHAVVTGGLAPRLSALWPSTRVAAMLADQHVDPRNGVTPGPAAIAGYAEPSVVFLLGTDTELDDAEDAAGALIQGQPVVVESRATPAFVQALQKAGVAAHAVGVVKGFDYSDRRRVALSLWRPTTAAGARPP